MADKNFKGGWRKRPKDATPQKALEYRNKGLKLKEIATMWQISVQQVHNLLEMAKISRMTPQEKQLSRALDCQEWLQQYIQSKYEGKLLRRMNLHLREIRTVLERDIPCQTQNGSASPESNLAPSASMETGVE